MAGSNYLLILGVLLLITTAKSQKDYDYEPAPAIGNAAGNRNEATSQKDPKSEIVAGEALVEGDKPPEEEEDDPSKTKFSDERFARLFPSRSNGRVLQPKQAIRPKPTLPSFIKSTPPIIKAQVNTTPVPRVGNLSNRRQASQTTTTKKPPTTSRNSLRGRGAQSTTTPRPLAGRLSTARPTSSYLQPTPSTTPSAAVLAARRRFGGGNNNSAGISRFQRNNLSNTNNANNATISSLNPRRN